MKEITKQYNTICDDYVFSLYDLWGHDDGECPQIDWIGERGDSIDLSDMIITFDQVRYIVDNNVPRETFVQYYDYIMRIMSISDTLPIMNLKSWHKGAPRISEERLEFLEGLKQKLYDGIEEIKEGAF